MTIHLVEVEKVKTTVCDHTCEKYNELGGVRMLSWKKVNSEILVKHEVYLELEELLVDGKSQGAI